MRGLAAFRAFFGAWLMVAPWLLGDGLDGWGINEALVGAAIVATAPWCERYLSLRITQSLLGIWLIVAPFVFEVGLLLICSDILVGKTLLVSGVISSEIFAPAAEKT